MSDTTCGVLDTRNGANRLCQRVQDAAVLAGRLAHDFDNLLMGVLGFAELALTETADGTPVHQYLTELQQVARRGVAVTQQMHDLSRNGRISPRATGLAEAYAVAAGAIDPSKAIRTAFDDDLPAVYLPAEPLALVLRHVLANAVEATPNGGEVHVEARAQTVDDPDESYLPRAVQPAEYVALSVTDAGPGIPADVLERIKSSPLVTTKPRHRGLGLAIVYRILDACNGGVRFEPVRPRGTRVTLMLPAAPAGRSIPTPPSSRTAPLSAAR